MESVGSLDVPNRSGTVALGAGGEAVKDSRVMLCSRSSDSVNELVVWVRVVTGRGEVTWARSFVCD